jgi:hypothetical protein
MVYDRLVAVNMQGLDIFHARTQTVISGGAFVRAASGALPATLTTGVGTRGGYGENTVQVDNASTSGNNIAPIGVALATAGSNSTVAFARKGDFILQAAGAIAVGEVLVSSQTGTNLGDVTAIGGEGYVASGTSNVSVHERVIGRAYVAAADNGYTLARIDL